MLKALLDLANSDTDIREGRGWFQAASLRGDYQKGLGVLAFLVEIGYLEFQKGGGAFPNGYCFTSETMSFLESRIGIAEVLKKAAVDKEKEERAKFLRRSIQSLSSELASLEGGSEGPS